jgi:hypothetical protein
MSEACEREQAVLSPLRKRWPTVFLAILFVLGGIAGSVGYALYPFEHAGPWTEALAFQRDLWSGVAMLGYVVCTASGIASIVCLFIRRRRL